MLTEKTTAKNDLFALVRSLSHAEKARFRQSVSLGEPEDESPIFFQLFEDLEALDDYDEADFKSSHSDRPYISRLPGHKNLLYLKLLNSLVNHAVSKKMEKKGESEISVRTRLEHAKMLLSKGLKFPAYRKLKQARKGAQAYEFHEVLLEILKEERRLFASNQGLKFEKGRNLADIHKEIAELIITIQEKYEMLQLRDEVFQLHRTAGHTVIGKTKQLYERILNEMLLNQPRPRLSFDAQSSYLFTLGMVYLMKRDLEKSYDTFKELKELWERHEIFRNLRIRDYVNVTANFLQLSIETKQLNGAFTQISKYEREYESIETHKGEFENNRIFLRLKYYIADCQWENALLVESELEEEAVRELIGPYLQVSRQIMYSISFVWLHLILGNNSKANKHLQQLLTYPETDGVGQDLRTHANVLNLIVQYELGNTEDLPRLYRSAIRQIKKSSTGSNFELLLLKFLNKLPDIKTTNLTAYFKEMHDSLRQLKEQPEEWFIIGMQFTLWWLESKFKPITLKEIFEREKSSNTGGAVG